VGTSVHASKHHATEPSLPACLYCVADFLIIVKLMGVLNELLWPSDK